MSGSHSHSSSLFVTRDGAPMRFYVRPGPGKKQLAPLITHGGGVVCRIQEPGAFLLADTNEGQLGPGYISSTFITDCVSSNRCLSPRAYRLLPSKDLKTRIQTRRSMSKLTLGGMEVQGETEGHKGRAAGPSQKQNPSSHNMRDLSPKGVHVDDEETKSLFDEFTTVLDDKKSCTSLVTPKEEATPKKEDHKQGSPGNEKRRSSRRLATRGRSPEEIISERNQKTLVGMAAYTGEANEDADGKRTAAHNTPSKTQRNTPSVNKKDVQQTLDEGENDCTPVDPGPRTSTPAFGRPNKMDVETDTAWGGALVKEEEESQLGTQVRRLTRRVAGKRRFSDGENQLSPDMKPFKVHKKPSEDTQGNPTGDAQTSVLKNHSAQIKAETQSGKDNGQHSECLDAETGEEKNVAKELDLQSPERRQAQSLITRQGNKTTDALKAGRMAFTIEEDVAILLYIRDNMSSSCTVTGNLLWKDMEKKKLLRRTWQAMKARYVKYLLYNKHRYKLPPKNSTGVSSSKIQRSGDIGPCLKPCTVISQESDANLPGASADILQKYVTTLCSDNSEISQNIDTNLPSAAAHVLKNSNTTLPCVSADIPQNCDSTSSDIPPKCHVIPPSASDGIHQVCDTRLPRSCTVTPQKNVSMLPSTSMDTTQKGDKMSPPAPSSKTVLPDEEDSDELHIFESANKEFEETDNFTSPEQSDPPSSQKENKNELHVHNDTSPKQPAPHNPQNGGNSSEKSNLLSSKNGDNSASDVGDATVPVQPDPMKSQDGGNSASHVGDATVPVQPDLMKSQDGGNSASHVGDTTVPVQPDPLKGQDGGNSAAHVGDTTVPGQPDPLKGQDGGNSAAHVGDTTVPGQPDPLKGQDGGNSASHVGDTTVPGQPDPLKGQDGGNSVSHVGDTTVPGQPDPLKGQDGGNSASHVGDTTVPGQSDPLKGQDGGNSALDVGDTTGAGQPHPMSSQNDDNTRLVQLHPPNSQNGNRASHVGDHTLSEEPDARSRQRRDSNLSHVDETPSNSLESECESLRQAMTDMMREFNLDVYCVTQALFFNNGELGSTRHFLRTGVRPDGFPIWDPKDDCDLKNNPKMQSHLIRKYGDNNVAKRVAFLAS